MSETFDPYYTWLGIQPNEQPPHCYRLLGVQLFEINADVISNAADRQMAYIRSFQTGQHADLSQKLLNELSNARLRLLDDGKKKAYDNALRKQLASPKTTSQPQIRAVPMSGPAASSKSPAAAGPKSTTASSQSSPPPAARSASSSIQRPPPRAKSSPPVVDAEIIQLSPLSDPSDESTRQPERWSFETLLEEYKQSLGDCERLYLTSAQQCADHYSSLFGVSSEEFTFLMDDLHKSLLIKIYVTVAGADGFWSENEKRLAQALFQHIWRQNLEGESLRTAAAQIFKQAEGTEWYQVIRPFDQIYQLRDHVGELETIVMRLANLVAKTDGIPQPSELASLDAIENEITSHLRPIPLDQPGQHEAAHVMVAEAVQQIETDVRKLHDQYQLTDQHNIPAPEKNDVILLQETEQEIDQLIGLSDIKLQFHKLVKSLQAEHQSQKTGNPPMGICHFAFLGNQGTGKTTIARKLGRALRAIGRLKTGHLVEIDAGGLIAGGAAHASLRIDKSMDEALNGVLFIDDSQLLLTDFRVHADRREAAAILLRRLARDASRLVVILAGPSNSMQQVLKDPRGVKTLIQHRWEFPDFTAGQLGAMFGQLCQKSHYRVPFQAQAKLLLGLQWITRHEQSQFNNGRFVRDMFERAVVNLSHRIAGESLSKDLLSVIEAADIEMSNVPPDVWQMLDIPQLRFSVDCPGCNSTAKIPADFLARKVKCNRCDHRFTAAWGEPLLP